MTDITVRIIFDGMLTIESVSSYNNFRITVGVCCELQMMHDTECFLCQRRRLYDWLHAKQRDGSFGRKSLLVATCQTPQFLQSRHHVLSLRWTSLSSQIRVMDLWPSSGKFPSSPVINSLLYTKGNTLSSHFQTIPPRFRFYTGLPPLAITYLKSTT